MADFVRQTALGGYKTVDGIDSLDCSHVILTKDEYKSLQWDIEKAHRDAASAKAMGEDRVKKAEEKAEANLKSLRYQASQVIQDLKQQLAEAQNEAARYRELNENLLQMNRKRANQDRDLRPKGKHTGYAVLQCTPKEYSWFTGSGKSKKKNTVILWETTMQTPYSVEFCLDQVERQVQELYEPDDNGNWIIGKLGIGGRWILAYEDILKEADGADWVERNTWIKDRLKYNGRDGYWELTITHTKCITGVPEDMRLPQKDKSKSK